MRLDISQGHFQNLNKAGLTLNSIYLLEQIINQADISGLDDRHSLSALQTLQRKGYVDIKMQVSQTGLELYQSLDTEILVTKKIKKQDDKFEEWWNVYPATDDFEINGRHFKGSQKKNIKKDECLVLFNKLINSGFTPDDIINATKYNIDNAKNLSLRKGTNQLSFITNSERYLREKCFEPFISKVQSKTKISDEPKTFEI